MLNRPAAPLGHPPDHQDAWNPDQLRRMELGGNEKLNNFLAQYGVAKVTDIRDKYNSKVGAAMLKPCRRATAGTCTGRRHIKTRGRQCRVP